MVVLRVDGKWYAFTPDGKLGVPLDDADAARYEQQYQQKLADQKLAIDFKEDCCGGGALDYFRFYITENGWVSRRYCKTSSHAKARRMTMRCRQSR